MGNGGVDGRIGRSKGYKDLAQLRMGGPYVIESLQSSSRES